ncbi:trans-aconitate 2-methyltransferase [Gordonia effusa NBRC 100432]|uniref:Trans-aconitate 2-methyltransferase n=1 Tax=Gordonia effusa NBRC 100432 TaxID=1077974 RepID=H0R3F6_9ACTN|nr:methyltransferase domain-containing protein [Gordonia effusa]GAB19607.1 trans-aconitate 2-methyltransferase [Gordonia effusa NBRC 100432]
MASWDPAQYLRFGDERTRPFLDLIGQIPESGSSVTSIADIGCGPGHLTRYLRLRWPSAAIVGVDSSAPMVERARAENTDEGVRYELADASSWLPTDPVDIMVSNATFQWLPDQFATIERLLTRLSPDGTIAIGVPDNADRPTHRLLDELAAEPRFAGRFDEIRSFDPMPPTDYADFFAPRGFAVNAWSTTYLHILRGEDPVYEWVSGTRLRPYLAALADAPQLRDEFIADYRAALRTAFPPRDWGTPLPFRRTFVVATRD